MILLAAPGSDVSSSVDQDMVPLETVNFDHVQKGLSDEGHQLFGELHLFLLEGLREVLLAEEDLTDRLEFEERVSRHGGDRDDLCLF